MLTRHETSPADTSALMAEIGRRARAAARPLATTARSRRRRASSDSTGCRSPDRVQAFPSNAAGERRHPPDLGGRRTDRLPPRGHGPAAVLPLRADGSWGPFWGSSHKHYEMAVSRQGSTHHFYAQPFLRSDHQIHLLSQDPGTGLDALREKSDTTATLTLVRYKELWGDQGAGSDVLTLNGTNVLTPAIAPRTKRLNGLFAFDAGLDGVTDLSAPIPSMAGLPFLSGADINLPATTPPSSSIGIVLTREAAGHRT